MVLCQDIEGEKPQAILKYAKKNKLGFLLLNILVMENLQENLPWKYYSNGQKKLKIQLKNS